MDDEDCPICGGDIKCERWRAPGHSPGWIVYCDDCSAKFDEPARMGFEGFEDTMTAVERMKALAELVRNNRSAAND